MRNSITAAVALVVVLLALSAPGTAFAPLVTVNELVENAREYDGLTVTIRGEVIGDVMRRGEITWINVNDGSSALGVWGPSSLFYDGLRGGGYKTRGDMVEVTGIFHRADMGQGGELDMQAMSFKVLQRATPMDRPLGAVRVQRTLAAAALAAAMLVVASVAGRPRRRNAGDAGSVA